MNRTARCLCGSLRANVEGEPVFVNVCHCLDYQRRTGSAFSYNAYFNAAQVRTEGQSTSFTRTGQEGRAVRHRFCPACGTTVWWDLDLLSGLYGIPLGLFEDTSFSPIPNVSSWERSKRSWVCLPEGMRHSDGPAQKEILPR
jgi:hypothetical protein